MLFQVRSQKAVVAASQGWEQFALRLVSSSIASPDDFESLSGKEDFLLTFADVIQQTCFLGEFQAYIKECGPGPMSHSFVHPESVLVKPYMTNETAQSRSWRSKGL